MAKNNTVYICQECGYTSPKWMGKCSNCGSWNSFVEKVEDDKENSFTKTNNSENITPSPISGVSIGETPRFESGLTEFDRVLGGGIVSGSLVLLGGAPGIGKSTLILQVASLFSKRYNKILYISGEESSQQIKLRSDRLNLYSDQMYILAKTNFEKIDQVLAQNDKYDLVVIDSIQTIYHPQMDSTPGSVSQVKAITNQLLKRAKKSGVPVILIGHVTKAGKIAGPKVLEHLVDTVLRFEGDRNYSYRILRADKNRFGSTNEVGVFTMTGSGLKQVLNPSQMFLKERPEGEPGSVIVPIIEGSRTILIEIQALVSSAAFGTPRRLTTGVDKKRLSIMLAVLEKKYDFNFYNQDIHLNITGGLKVDEPALDLGMVTAVISSFKGQSLPSDLAVVGEVGLAGEVRAVSHIKKRIKELLRMGFKEIIFPAGNKKNLEFDEDMNLSGVKNIKEVLDLLFS